MGRRERLRAFIVLLAALTGISSPASALDMQRMVLAPAACHALPPGASTDAGAYCLDQSRLPPADGSILSRVPATLDEAVVKAVGLPPLTLSQALARHVVQIEGQGNDRLLRITNVTDRTVEICINGPTVVMGNGEADPRDVAAFRKVIARVMSQGSDRGDGQAHAATQQELWDAVNKIDQEESKKMTRDLVAPPLLPPQRKSASGASSPAKCADGSHGSDLALCVE